jgi:medium-chain acyl-[acyl-carrier-protein] hydrolase
VPVIGKWIREINKPRDDTSLTLLCCPHAGAGPTCYRRWPTLLAQHVHVLAVQLPGRGVRSSEPAVASMEVVIDGLVEELRKHAHAHDGRLAVWGHSFGATVAHALAIALTGEIRTPLAALFVAGKNAPWSPERRPALHTLPDDELWEAAGTFGGTPKSLLSDREVRQLFLPALRADLTIAEKYRPAPTLSAVNCPVRAFTAINDPIVSTDGMAAWAKVNEDDFVLREFRGGHFFVHENEDIVAGAVNDELSKL